MFGTMEIFMTELLNYRIIVNEIMTNVLTKRNDQIRFEPFIIIIFRT